VKVSSMEQKLKLDDFRVGAPTAQEMKDNFAKRAQHQEKCQDSSDHEINDSFKAFLEQKFKEAKEKKATSEELKSSAVTESSEIIDEQINIDFTSRLDDSKFDSSQEIESSFVIDRKSQLIKFRSVDRSSADTSSIYNDTTMPMSTYSSLPSDSTLSSESSMMNQEKSGITSDEGSSLLDTDVTQGSVQESSLNLSDSVFF
jgi:hypothetical protein